MLLAQQSARQGPVAVSVLGPPAAGKSSLTATLASRHRGLIFRLREYARHRAAHDEGLAQTMRTSTDPLGWVPDPVALSLIDHALHGPFRPSPGILLLLEGFPGNPVQAVHTAGVLDRMGVELHVVELLVDQESARRRAQTRRVCPACESGSADEPHRPATAGPDGGCARCGGPLRARRDDTADLLAARTGRFRQHHPRIRREFQTRGVPWHTIDTRCSPAAVVAAAEAALGICPSLHPDPGALIP
ncbi:adenylate kinase family protein [Sphaerisporangium album]|uniref:adenylate kinase family protein n=1 Tax=Sphaerisporangium album TaxID=509200 RepID=UPI0015EFEB33|nr:nucleoside monophosphate kinase [Sphaerisporangium album]